MPSNDVSRCPDYPTPIELNQNDPLLIKAYQQVDQIIQDGMNQTGLLSFVATIVYRDQIVWSKAYGKVNPLDENSPPLTIDNTVRIASITKVFTDLMMFQLRDKGLINLDDPISKYYPEFSVLDPYHTKREITFRELASHQAGLPREVPCDFNSLPDPKVCGEKTILERLAKQFLILPQYTQTHYSNLGLALLGRTLERAAQLEYEKYVEEKILNPLGMKNSSFNYEKIKDRMAVGLMEYPNGTYATAPIIGLGWGTPMGGLYATARDMSRFASFWLSEKSDILDSSTMKEALAPINLVSDGSTAYGTPFEMYYDQPNNIWVKSKAGALNGYRSQLALVKPLRLGVFFSGLMFVNSDDLFTKEALDVLIPVYEALLYEQNSKPQSFISTIPSSKPGKKDGLNKPTPLPLNTFVGTYGVDGGYFRINLDNQTDSLTANFDDSNIFNVTRFHADYPLVYRIQVAQAQSYSCVFVEDGSNYELIYFELDKSNPSQCESVQVMGQPMALVSKDPNYNKIINNNINQNQKKRSSHHRLINLL
eukprot:gene11352-13899_t